MADPKTAKDFEAMSDDDFLKLDPNEYSGDLPEGEVDFSKATPPEEEIQNEEPAQESTNTVDDDNNGDGGEPDGSQSDPDSQPGSEEGQEEDPNKEPDGGEGEENGSEEDPSVQQQPVTDPKEKGKTVKPEESGDGQQPVVKPKEEKPQAGGKETPAKAGYYKLPEGMDNAKMDNAVGFYQKITAPFKADGKDFTIRSAEDAIRLMQQGVNYSRRMQEIKPMKALNRVLQDNGLDNQSKLNFAIDLMSGDKAAITQLLKSHKIDPMDLDVEKDSGYQANNYAGNAQDNEFRDALDETVTTPEGQALVTHIQKDWDKTSKGRLREDPSILGNLAMMKQSGVYDKVVEELNYQKSMGYLTNIPFLQAFDTVGEAMKKAGVFDSQQPAANGGMAPLASQPETQPNTPITSGARKAPSTKKDAPNPHLSSTPPSKQGTQKLNTPNFDKMSDEEFLKMPPPE